MQIFCSSPWVPVEWIAAHGLAPRGVWSDPNGPAGAAPEGVCAFAQRLAEFPRTHPSTPIILTTACDQVRRAADSLTGDAPPWFLFNLPATWQTSAARRLYHQELERLGRFLVRQGGHAPAAGALAAIQLDWECRRQRLREALLHVGARPAAELLMAFFHDGAVPQAAPRPASAGVPLALVGGPLLRSQLDLFDAVESVGGSVVLNATEPGERCLLPPWPDRPAGQSPLALLAGHYFDHAVDVFHRPNSRLYAWLGTRLVGRRARGIVLWVHVGCDLWRAEAASLREAFGLPVLILDQHETRGIGPRDLTRLGAFVESLR